MEDMVDLDVWVDAWVEVSEQTFCIIIVLKDFMVLHFVVLLIWDMVEASWENARDMSNGTVGLANGVLSTGEMTN